MSQYGNKATVYSYAKERANGVNAEPIAIYQKRDNPYLWMATPIDSDVNHMVWKYEETIANASKVNL